jgi:hypothetical protein
MMYGKGSEQASNYSKEASYSAGCSLSHVSYFRAPNNNRSLSVLVEK